MELNQKAKCLIFNWDKSGFCWLVWNEKELSRRKAAVDTDLHCCAGLLRALSVWDFVVSSHSFTASSELINHWDKSRIGQDWGTVFGIMGATWSPVVWFVCINNCNLISAARTVNRERIHGTSRLLKISNWWKQKPSFTDVSIAWDHWHRTFY